MLSPEAVHALLDNAVFKFAKSMPNSPHDYTKRLDWEDDRAFCDVVQFIRDNGTTEKFYKRTFIYYYYGEYKYWTMGNLLSYTDKTKTFILNRAKV